MEFKDLFEDRSYIDLWSVAHFATGAALGFIFLKLKLKFVLSLFFVFVLSVLWEIVEPSFYVNILGLPFTEVLSNQVLDVVFNLSGFLVTWFSLK